MDKINIMKNIYCSNLKSRGIIVINYLVYRSNKELTCFPAIKTIANDCNISPNTVKRALADLVIAGYVKKDPRFMESKNGAQTSNLYTLSVGTDLPINPITTPKTEEIETIEQESFEVVQKLEESAADVAIIGNDISLTKTKIRSFLMPHIMSANISIMNLKYSIQNPYFTPNGPPPRPP